LSIGYFSGYFLLVFGRSTGRGWDRPSPLWRALGSLIILAISVAVVALPAGLVYKNLPRIRDNNSAELMQYGARLADSLPPEGAIVLSDDSERLYSVAAALDQRGIRNKFALLETTTLSFTIYQRYLHRHLGERMPPNNFFQSTNEVIDPATLTVYFAEVARTNAVCYLHPSFGYYFEMTFAKPRGLVYQLVPYPTNSVEQPPLTLAEIQQTEAAWDKVREDLQAISRHAKRDPKNPYLHLNAAWVGAYYSRALDAWAVELQKHDQWAPAAARIDQALAVNPENAVAFINREYNRQWRQGKRGPIELTDTIKTKLDPYRRNPRTILAANGPFDEPAFTLDVGQVFLSGRLYRQAAQNFLRVRKLTPENFQAALLLADLYVQTRLVKEALELVSNLRAQNHPGLQNPTNQIALIGVEGAAYLATNNVDAAAEIFAQAERAYPKNADLCGMIANVYANFGDYSNALAAADKQLSLVPDNSKTLLNFSAYCIELREFDRAINALSKLIAREPDNVLAIHNRAIAHLRKADWDAAQKDYEALERLLPQTPPSVHYGLGEIAYRKNQIDDAIRYHTSYLKNAPPGTQEARFVSDRLKELKRKKSKRSA
jgi:tetratricopeptide (TPR) repeat protein